MAMTRQVTEVSAVTLAMFFFLFSSGVTLGCTKEVLLYCLSASTEDLSINEFGTMSSLVQRVTERRHGISLSGRPVEVEIIRNGYGVGRPCLYSNRISRDDYNEPTISSR